ncbi:MAG: response regulator [Magnetococcales bacterium]|nr:response regulator [Magnetococcales bacterium]
MAKKILVVDDSETIRQAVSFTLKNAGYDTSEAPNGLVALKEADSGKVDLVITDLNMNFMDGLELIRKLRGGAGPNKFTPILMLTTESAMEKKEEGKAAGATGWIVKPFIPEKLLAVVEKVLR